MGRKSTHSAMPRGGSKRAFGKLWVKTEEKSSLCPVNQKDFLSLRESAFTLGEIWRSCCSVSSFFREKETYPESLLNATTPTPPALFTIQDKGFGEMCGPLALHPPRKYGLCCMLHNCQALQFSETEVKRYCQ